MRNKMLISIAIIVSLWILSYFASYLIDDSGVSGGNIAVIPVKGVITVESATGYFSSATASSETLVKNIKDAAERPEIKAILLDINSPGGSPVATDEIARALKDTDKMTVSVIREVGASGAYWIASATDYVFANRMSITGSIGVIGSYLNYGDLLNRYNVTYERFVAGQYKDLGVPTREMSDEEREKLQALLDRMHEFFMEEVKDNRGLTDSEIKDVATGMVFLGVEAKELRLIDELGNKDDAIKYIEDSLNITADIVTYKEKKSLSDVLAGLSIGTFINPITQKFTISI